MWTSILWIWSEGKGWKCKPKRWCQKSLTPSLSFSLYFWLTVWPPSSSLTAVYPRDQTTVYACDQTSCGLVWLKSLGLQIKRTCFFTNEKIEFRRRWMSRWGLILFGTCHKQLNIFVIVRTHTFFKKMISNIISAVYHKLLVPDNTVHFIWIVPDRCRGPVNARGLPLPQADNHL